MNERINELIKQSYVTVRSQNDRDVTYFSQEKFAELIVEECVQTLINNMPEGYTNEAAADWVKGYDRAMKDCVYYILEHFGVEE